MKNITLAATALISIIALFLSGNSFFVIRSQRCREAHAGCVRRCDDARARKIGEIQLQRSTIQLALGQALTACRIDNLGDQAAIDQCQQEVRARVQPQLDHLDALENEANLARTDCVNGCNSEAKRCDRHYLPESIDLVSDGGLDIDKPVVIDCLEGGPPCFKDVLDICTKISGPCDDCWRTLCGGGDWSFESDVPVEITLVAARDPSSNPRVLARSAVQAGKALLAVPRSIKLNAGERLFFGFTSNEKPSGGIKLRIHRNRNPAI